MSTPNSPTAREAITHRSILAIAVPIMISNLSTPLLGVVDTGVIGQIPDASLIGAVALGALIFNFVFWAFGFLRMGTTGLTAQAFGADNTHEIRASVGRALLIAAVIGVCLILLQWPIRQLAFWLLEASERVEQLAQSYFDIRIWAAPATLANYALLGWFIGLGKARTALLLQLVLNVSNMLLDAWFVLGLDMGVRGVATGTVIAEYLAAAVGLLVAAQHLHVIGGKWEAARLFEPARIARTIAVNRDIMIRSLSLIFVFSWFIAQGAKFGETVLAANAVLMHFVAVSAYFLDGFAFAAEALVGKAVGAAHRAGLTQASRMTTWWAGGVALFATLILVLFGSTFIDILTVEPGVRSIARQFLPWAAMAPLVGVWAFQLDGIFIGATRSADMRNAMLMSAGIFLVAWYLLRPLANQGLWAALYVHYAARTFTLLYYFPGLRRSVPA
ncbi:MAG: MATE family efflux transporter [Gammaproteobacteria bacterium]|jgi:MATE family multidrug resistance protein|nr:MATE family efflux transporter [Gammaproteobacteria bacterium]